MSIMWRGLDLLNCEETTEEEMSDLRSYNDKAKGYTPPSHNMWLDWRPDVYKRKLLTVWMADTDETRDPPGRNTLAALHYYVTIGYPEGILYEIRQGRYNGLTKGHIVDTLAIAYAHGHAFGLNRTAESGAREYLDQWTEEDNDAAKSFPPGWAYDPDAFRSGLDFSAPDLSAAERTLLEDWYREKVGEVPRYVSFLAELRPRLLKAHRNRYETAVRNGLPREMVPYMLLYFNVVRGFRDGIREQVLLLRNFGVEREYIIGCMGRAMTSYGGPDAISIADEAAGDILRAM